MEIHSTIIGERRNRIRHEGMRLDVPYCATYCQMQGDEDDQSNVIKSCQERHGPDPIKRRRMLKSWKRGDRLRHKMESIFFFNVQQPWTKCCSFFSALANLMNSADGHDCDVTEFRSSLWRKRKHTQTTDTCACIMLFLSVFFSLFFAKGN